MPAWLQLRDNVITLALRVQPRAARDEFAGAANAHLCRFIADLFGVAPARVRLLKGLSGRDKLVAVAGVTGLPESLVHLNGDGRVRDRPE